MKKLLIVLFALIIFAAGCAYSVTFSGSKTGNNKQFLVGFDVLNTTVDSKMQLTEGDKIKTAIDIKKGDVDIIVKNEKGTIAYQGNDVASCGFTIEIEETGTYTFYIKGSKAKGRVYFTKQ
ncbi:MAG: hypothetical protein PHV32_10180 [Eubacteriales bacterium]|nr:hypothetical protein [Eubacteriales bacterium]